jgi:hypothetical protein
METHAMDSNYQDVWKLPTGSAQTVQTTTEMQMEDALNPSPPAKTTTPMDNASNAKPAIN